MREHDFIERTQISLTSWKTLKINSHTNRGTSEGSETLADKHSTRRIQICVVYFCLVIIWKVILKKEVKNKFYKNRPSRSGFSSPRGFQRRSWNCRSSYGFFGNCFLCAYFWRSIQLYIFFLLFHTRFSWGSWRRDLCSSELRCRSFHLSFRTRR